jgi:hypothetical protein
MSFPHTIDSRFGSRRFEFYSARVSGCPISYRLISRGRKYQSSPRSQRLSFFVSAFDRTIPDQQFQRSRLSSHRASGRCARRNLDLFLNRPDRVLQRNVGSQPRWYRRGLVVRNRLHMIVWSARNVRRARRQAQRGLITSACVTSSQSMSR